MDIGIDVISFYTSKYYLDLAELAKARQIDVNKFHIGLGQYKMSVTPPDEDIVTLASNAARRILEKVDSDNIDTLLFATETGIDQSKAAGIYLHKLLKLSSRCRVVELKQACYSSTAALQMAIGLVQRKPESKILVVASDISRYQLNTAQESSQGCGAVAFLVTKNPRLLVINHERGIYTEDIMDFWRPNYLNEALVDGKFSTEMYFHALEETWRHYQAQSNRQFQDHDFYCYHTPIPRLVEKAHTKLVSFNQVHLSEQQIKQQVQPALNYSRVIGNSYSAALYISLVSLLDNINGDYNGSHIGFYSYGSGCVAEYFSGVLQSNYQQQLNVDQNKKLLDSREEISMSIYKDWHDFKLPIDGSNYIIPKNKTGHFRLHSIKDHQRIYEEV